MGKYFDREYFADYLVMEITIRSLVIASDYMVVRITIDLFFCNYSVWTYRLCKRMKDKKWGEV